MTFEASDANSLPPPLLVWDADFAPWQWDGHIALWKGFAKAGAHNTSSIHSIIEEKSDESSEATAKDEEPAKEETKEDSEK